MTFFNLILKRNIFTGSETNHHKGLPLFLFPTTYFHVLQPGFFIYPSNIFIQKWHTHTFWLTPASCTKKTAYFLHSSLHYFLHLIIHIRCFLVRLNLQNYHLLRSNFGNFMIQPNCISTETLLVNSLYICMSLYCNLFHVTPFWWALCCL